MNRRTALALAAGSIWPIGDVAAQSWAPARSLRIIVPLAPGGTADTLARIVAEPLGAQLGQTVIVENRAGGTNTVGAIAVARSAPDGLTMLYAPPPVQILNPLMMRTMPYDAFADFTPLIALMRAPKLLVVRPDSPARSIAQMAGIELLHIPYRGTAPGTQDVMAGRVDMTLDTAAALLPLVREGRLRALAVSTRDRAEAAPELPPIAETLPGFHDASFNYLLLPARTPPEIIAALNAALNKVLAEPAIRARFAALGAEALGGTPEALAAMVREEIERWRGVIQAQGITIE